MLMNQELIPQQVAEHCAEALLLRDHTARSIGANCEQVGPGHSRFNMTVRQQMLNSHQTCHGGMIFTLADTAFAYACNSYNQVALATSCSIEFLRPVYLGDILTADAREQSLNGRSGVYDITITNQNSQTVALFRGKSLQIREEVITNIGADK